MSLELETVELASFGKEYAGRRVGWVALVDVEGEPGYPDITYAHAVAATVDSSGAHASFEKDPYTGELYTSTHSVTGFRAVAAATALVNQHTGRLVGNNPHAIRIALEQPFHRRGPSASQHILSAGEGQLDVAPDEITSRRQWLTSQHQIMPALRQLLERRDMDPSVFAALYYGLNAYALSPSLRKMSSLDIVDPTLVVMPDPAMSEQTEEQIAHAAAVHENIRAGRAANEQFVYDADVNPDIRRDQLPKLYLESRHTIAQHEAAAAKAGDHIVPRLRLAYRPPGETASWLGIERMPQSERQDRVGSIFARGVFDVIRPIMNERGELWFQTLRETQAQDYYNMLQVLHGAEQAQANPSGT